MNMDLNILQHAGADASREQGPREAGMRPSRVGRGAGKRLSESKNGK